MKRETLTKALPIDTLKERLDDYRPRIRIDEHALERELIAHPDLIREINDNLTLAISYRDEAKGELEIESGEFDQGYRLRNAGDKRITDTEVKAAQVLDPSVAKLRREIIDWNLIVGYWENLSDAAHQRGYMLTKLVELYMYSYFGDVTGRGERAATRDKLAGEARARWKVDAAARLTDGHR
jgi:hypothetical protein